MFVACLVRDQEGASAAEKLPSVQPLSQACTDLVIKQDVDQDETPGQAAASVPSGPGEANNNLSWNLVHIELDVHSIVLILFCKTQVRQQTMVRWPQKVG